jgi:hypothetical protein
MRLSEKIDNLPAEIRAEVIDFMEYLLAKHSRQQEQAVIDQSLDAVLAFRGLGAEIRQNTDPDQYIPELRADW